MREIKFRLWDKDAKKMIYHDDFVAHLINIKLNGLIIWGSLDMTNDLIKLQYAGLKDKNGIEIYEGDIVQIDFGKGQYVSGIIKSKVIFEEGKFTVESCLFKLEYLDQIEIIGNVYQNPEQLGEA